MNAERRAEVWKTLGTVTDPEIDEAVTDLEFITAVEGDDAGGVRVAFRLPTYWCSPNFAFLMASDMRDALRELPWVRQVTVELLDHFSAPLINRSVALNLDFRQAFPGETDGDLEPLRRTFLGKAFERRQELLLSHLRRRGEGPESLVALRLGELAALLLDFEGNGLRNLYLFARRKVHPDRGDDSPAFLALDGAALDLAQFAAHLRHLRGARITPRPTAPCAAGCSPRARSGNFPRKRWPRLCNTLLPPRMRACLYSNNRIEWRDVSLRRPAALQGRDLPGPRAPDPHRHRRALRRKELSAGQLIQLLELEQANASQHLAVLRAKRIVRRAQAGQPGFYSLRDKRWRRSSTACAPISKGICARRGRISIR